MENITETAANDARNPWIKHVAPVLSALAVLAAVAAPAHAEPQRIALLGVHLQNDNEGYEPTSDAERARMQAIATSFKKQLDATGRYSFVPVSADEQKKIDGGQLVGACGGCEYDYAHDLGVDQVAYIRVQKISNLILNMNVYMADARSQKTTFIKSVDLRNNSDESWMRGLKYLVQNYLLPNYQG